EFEGTKSRGERGTIALVSVLGIITPFVLGATAAVFLHGKLGEGRPPLLPFVLILAVSVSITALPVLGRIFLETGFGRTYAGRVALRAAVINDVVGWLLLGSVSLVIAGQFSGAWLAWRVAGAAAITALVFLAVRPLLGRYFVAHLTAHGRLKHTGISVGLMTAFA